MATRRKGKSGKSSRTAAKKGAAKKTSSRAATPRRASSGGRNTGEVKRELIEAFRREWGKTMKVLRALPSEHAELRPHPRLKTARELAWTFVIEAGMVTRALTGQPVFSGGTQGPPPVPQQMNAVIDQVERSGGDVDRVLMTMNESVLDDVIQFPVGPKQMGDWTKRAFAWFILADHIHHRGQMSVYLRIAGGKVPAIYGPSGDEPWL